MLCLNAEGKAGADIVVESSVEELDRVARWGMIVIFEADRTLSSKDDDDILLPQPSGHKVLRPYGGKGIVSYKVMVHRVLAPRVMRVVTADRSVRVDLQNITVGDASRKLCSQQSFLFSHFGFGDGSRQYMKRWALPGPETVNQE